MAKTRFVDESTLQGGASKLQKMTKQKRHSIREAVFALGPDMDAAVKSGHTRTSVIESVAETLGVVKELVWRYDTQRRKPDDEIETPQTIRGTTRRRKATTTAPPKNRKTA
jgi:hypothetical protein